MKNKNGPITREREDLWKKKSHNFITKFNVQIYMGILMRKIKRKCSVELGAQNDNKKQNSVSSPFTVFG